MHGVNVCRVRSSTRVLESSGMLGGYHYFVRYEETIRRGTQGITTVSRPELDLRV